MRSKKRQERMEEGQSSVDTAQIMDRIAAMQAQLNDRLDDINDKIVDIQNLNKISIFGVSRLHYIRSKRSWQLKHNEEGEIKPLKTLKTCVLVRDVMRKESSFLAKYWL
ncbi:hypothetical protein M9H77_02049 [Catharanthus roseus]|uniref:Uncharacterized protein n=1 Tax=Catharanthus roseus TaxID=4058 RepID=A0ACC0C7H8_CATRO|nr:hypothetical protein M9H77_02049 [Catharanthus roseus]